MTPDDQPLDKYEEEQIIDALKYEKINFNGEFDIGREINNFTGDTLLVGGGKLAGRYGENQGKTVLIDNKANEKEIKEVIDNLRSGEWDSNPYTGEKFKTKEEKEAYIKKLEYKLLIYKEAFEEKNKDILKRYYTINIAKDLRPDILASINSEEDMCKIPDNKFMHVEFENVPCFVFLNPKLYPILERITKPGGTISFSIHHDCHRLIIPIIQPTKFGKEFMQKIKTEMYNKLDNMDLSYGVDITINN